MGAKFYSYPVFKEFKYRVPRVLQKVFSVIIMMKDIRRTAIMQLLASYVNIARLNGPRKRLEWRFGIR